MIINSSQSIQSSNPLGSISSRRVSSEFRSSNTNPEDKKNLEVQQQRDDAIVRQLRSRDREVRAHEGAHVAAGGSLVRGGPSYTYQTGPDGRSYAIGGEVQIDASAVANDPQATLTKSSQIRAAALAPANPSSQDIRVASNANQLASRARVDIAVQRREEVQLEENQRTIDDSDLDTTDADNDSSAGNVESASGVIDTTNSASAVESVGVTGIQASAAANNLQSSDEPVAAISSFMSAAQPVSTPVLFNRFA